MKITEQLQAECKRLLETGKVDVVLGYERGALPLRSRPLVMRSAEDVDKAIWDQTCDNSVAVYIPGLDDDKVGVITRGCDGRWLVQHIGENRIKRENLVVIGVPCSGVISRDELAQAVDNRPIVSADIDGDYVTVQGHDWEKKVAIRDVLAPSCKVCFHPASPIVDIELGRSERDDGKVDFSDVTEIDKMSAEERWQWFSAEISKCIRCYACRQACPGCYCKECVADRTDPVLIGNTDDVSDAFTFHILRALHLAGRCVDCGACERACPVGVKLRVLNRKLELDARKLYDHIPGLDADGKPMISDYRPDDPEDFIL